MQNHFKKIISLLLFAVLLTACGPAGSGQPGKAGQTQPAPPTPLRQTAAPGSLSIGSVSLTSSGKSPDYSIKTDIPVLQGPYPHRNEFNLRVSEMVTQATDAFKKNLADWTPTPDSTESSFIVSYGTFPFSTRFASIQLMEETYMAGAAHPSHQIISLVYDLENGQEVTLNQLFLPNSNYLQVIADTCKAELRKREIGFDEQQQGADPTPQNYAVWNLSTDGLVITFNEYQVAAYAAGPQMVTIPWAALKAVVDPQGPIQQSEK